MPSNVFSPETLSSNFKVASGEHTTVAAADTIPTGLRKVLYAVASLRDAPVIGADRALADVGDQAGTPPSGSILIRTYKPTSTADTTPIAATTFSRRVHWFAFGY